jgi:hypothetical protein
MKETTPKCPFPNENAGAMIAKDKQRKKRRMRFHERA